MKPTFRKISVSTMWKSSKEHLYHGKRPKFKTDSKRQRQKDIGQMGNRRFGNGSHQVLSREILQEILLHKVLQREILPNFTILRLFEDHSPPTVMTLAPTDRTLAPIERTSEYSSLLSIAFSEIPSNSLAENPSSLSDSVRSSHFLSSLGTHSLNSVPLELISQQNSEDLDVSAAYRGNNSSDFGGNQVGCVLNSYQSEASNLGMLESISLPLSLLSSPSSNACNSELSCNDIESSGISISLYNESRVSGTDATSGSDPQIEPRSSSAQSVGISELNTFDTNEGISFYTSDRLGLLSIKESSLASISSVYSFEGYGNSLDNPAGLPLNGPLSDPSRNSPVDELFAAPETFEVGNIHHDAQELPMSFPCHQTVGTQSLVAMTGQSNLSGQQTSLYSVSVDKDSSSFLAEFLPASLHTEQIEEETEGRPFVLQASLSAGVPDSLLEIFHTQELDAVRLDSTFRIVHGDIQSAPSSALIHNGSLLGTSDLDQVPEIEEAHWVGAEESTNELMPILLTPAHYSGLQESDQVQEDDFDLTLLNLGAPYPVLLGFPLQDDVDVNDIDIDLRLMRINHL